MLKHPSDKGGGAVILVSTKRCETGVTALFLGYFFVQEEISEIVSNNCNLTSLIIPYAFVDDNTFLFIIESLQNLTHICVCETNVSQARVDRTKIRKPLLNICWNVNHTP